MQFIVIEWQVYSLTKDPLSLGIIGACEFIPAFFVAPFAGHIVDQKEKTNLFALCIAAFSLISLGLYLLTFRWCCGELVYPIYFIWYLCLGVFWRVFTFFFWTHYFFFSSINSS